MLPRRLAAPAPGWTLRGDVVVVGSGIAGLTTALRLRRRVGRVVLVTKTVLTSGATPWAQGGVAAALGLSDSPQAHLADTLAAGGGLCDEDAVRVLVTRGPAAVRELADLGARFDTGPDGALALTREGGHGTDRIAHAGGDATGAEISRALVAALVAVRDDPGIEVVEHALALDVLTAAPTPAQAAAGRPGRAVGVSVHVLGEGSRDGVGAVLGRAVVLATGGTGQVWSSTTNPREATGDGVAAALRAGATLADLEFVQFHPTVLWLGGAARGQQPLVSEAVRGEGALLVDAAGTRFMPAVHPLAELAPRDVVASAIVDRMAVTGTDHVYLDARHLGRERLLRRFPTIAARLAQHDFDLAEDLVPVGPAQHYHSGGVRTGATGRTDVDGLYAVGECACTGVHGANRLASNSLLEGLVFAGAIADDLAGRLRDGELPPGEPAEPGGADEEGLVPAHARVAVQRAASRGPGVLRDGDGLAAAAQALDALGSTKAEGPASSADWETTNLHHVAAAVTAAAALRTESRGGHARRDHPGTDPAWRVRVLLARSPDGALTTSTGPLEVP
jgi:L-aspartate oxidase